MTGHIYEGEYGKLVRNPCGCDVQTYDVYLGDWSEYPGIEHETRDNAMDAVATAIAELQDILAKLAKEPS